MTFSQSSPLRAKARVAVNAQQICHRGAKRPRAKFPLATTPLTAFFLALPGGLSTPVKGKHWAEIVEFLIVYLAETKKAKKSESERRRGFRSGQRLECDLNGRVHPTIEPQGDVEPWHTRSLDISVLYSFERASAAVQGKPYVLLGIREWLRYGITAFTSRIPEGSRYENPLRGI